MASDKNVILEDSNTIDFFKKSEEKIIATKIGNKSDNFISNFTNYTSKSIKTLFFAGIYPGILVCFLAYVSKVFDQKFFNFSTLNTLSYEQICQKMEPLIRIYCSGFITITICSFIYLIMKESIKQEFKIKNIFNPLLYLGGTMFGYYICTKFVVPQIWQSFIIPILHGIPN
jgi:TRAP-type C4-dicarboxylate transport system permease large subunit